MAVHLCLDKARASKTKLEIDTGAMPELRSGEPSAETEAIREQQKQALLRALKDLPERERAAVVLREIEGFSTGEVAAILGSSEVTVRSQISRAISTACAF